jgi:putative hemolysin
MTKIDLTQILHDRFDLGWISKSRYLKTFLFMAFQKFLRIKEINEFIAKNEHMDEKHFINEVFEMLNFSYLISSSDIQKIPSEGRLICVANHPLGSLDSLSLLKAILEIRNDVKIIANDMLYNIDNLKNLFLPFKLDSTHVQKENVLAIYKAIKDENAVIIFPAAKVSRLKWFKVMDSAWNKGAVRFANKFDSPVLPVYIYGKNSFLFYFVSFLNTNASMLLLVHELFNKRNKSIRIRIGDLIPAKAFKTSYIDEKYQTKLLKKHVYQLGSNQNGIFVTEKNIIHPIDRKILKRELNNANHLGTTKEGMKLFLTTKSESPQALMEIARLRELTFRKVGEGTGCKLDLDKFDNYYSHLIVWDEHELEIVGSYRIAKGEEIISQRGRHGFYTSTLFNFSDEFISNYLNSSIELGRSFVQKKYWNTNALNYLWQGIGAFLAKNESVKYLFGGVSISNSYPEIAKELIIFFFFKWYADQFSLAQSKRRFVINAAKRDEFSKMFYGTTPKEDYRILKNMLKPYGFAVPVLYKHYSELCDENGVKFLDFGIDPDFENCVDGLILVHVDLIKEEKKQKYIKPQSINKFKISA